MKLQPVTCKLATNKYSDVCIGIFIFLPLPHNFETYVVSYIKDKSRNTAFDK